MQLLLLIEDALLQEYEVDGVREALESFLKYIEKYIKKHDLWIICNAMYPKAVKNLRQALKGKIFQKKIILFSLPFGGSKVPSHIEANTEVFNYFLSQFQADLLITFRSSQNKNTTQKCHIQFNRIKRTEEKSFDVLKHKPKLAYFSPIPPAKSGIAGYSMELLPYLCDYYDITVVMNEKTNLLREEDLPYRFLSVEDFKEENETYDRILYHFGNSFYHSYMWPMIKAYPGIVVLHDFYLSGLLSYEEIVNGKKAFWTEQIFKSHGYHALQMRFDAAKDEELKYRYPCNYEILQYAKSIIVHSDYAKKLANNWYRVNPLTEWNTIPLLRETAKDRDKKKSRSLLGLPENALVICSFGVLNATKLNHMLLQAFLHSELSEMKDCYLVFVGENNSGEYAIKLEKNIKTSGIREQIKITGWIDDDTFHHYLSAADIGVQLRTASRGESSASVLDCMNYGLATIVNANGSMAELPQDALYMLENDFKEDALIEALNLLGKEEDTREKLSWKAKAFIHRHHDPLTCASRYHDVIESTHRSCYRYTSLLHALAALENIYEDTANLTALSESIAVSTIPTIEQKQLLIDVSVISKNDMRTGIERVVRAQLLEIIIHAPDSIRVEPVYLDEDEENGLFYRYARKFACTMLDLPVDINDDVVVVNTGDIFYAPDFYPQGVIKAAEDGLYQQWSAKGVKISFLIHDILPIQYPHFFPEGSSELHNQWMETITKESDILICTSNTGAENVRIWIHDNYMKSSNMLPAVETVYLGSDIAASSPSADLPEEAEKILDQISKLPTFLMVGTIEPRKGHLQTIAAFDKLWEDGLEANLVIVGKEGWKGLPDTQRRTIPKTITTLQQHSQLGEHLFWLNGISDLFLEKLYHTSTVLIVASEDEGFGLPLIEGAHHKLPLIVRDIPIFRELAKDNAFYFKNSLEPVAISDAITEWLALYHEQKHPLSNSMHTIIWEESAEGILSLLIDEEEIEPKNLPSKSFNLEETANSHLSSQHQSQLRLSTRAKEIYHSLLQQTHNGEQRS